MANVEPNANNQQKHRSGNDKDKNMGIFTSKANVTYDKTKHEKILS